MIDAATMEILVNAVFVIASAGITAIVQYYKHKKAKEALTEQAQMAANQGDTLYDTAMKTLTVVEALFPKANSDIASAKSLMVTIKAIWDDESASDEQLRKAYDDYSQLMDSLLKLLPQKDAEGAVDAPEAN